MGCTSSKYKVYPIKFQESNLEYESKVCIICLDDFKKINKLTLPCGHNYHHECILIWFDTKMLCPYCKTPYTWCKNSKKIKN